MWVAWSSHAVRTLLVAEKAYSLTRPSLERQKEAEDAKVTRTGFITGLH